MPDQSSLELSAKSAGPVECLGRMFPSENARREHYLTLLAGKLKEPEFRKIEGFPAGTDDAILSLSDPPYYTACPNPWLGEFVKFYGTSYNPKKAYHREPFAADVSDGKNHAIYNAHSYHTKVPHRAIMRYILHYTEPGQIVFDGFCGTGMTGVAAQLCGDRAEVQALGYRVLEDGTILNEEGKAFSKIGARKPILNDLSPAAAFLAYNYNTPVDDFEREAKQILTEVENSHGWIYTTIHDANAQQLKRAVEAVDRATTFSDLEIAVKNLPDLKVKVGRVNYVVWSDVFLCPECGSEVDFWEQAVVKKTGEVLDDFPCPKCHSILSKRSAEPARTSIFDHALNVVVTQTKQSLALVNYTASGKRFEKKADEFDSALASKLESFPISEFFPSQRMPEGDEARRNDPAGITNVHHFYSKRNLWLLAAMLKRSTHQSLTCALLDGHSVGTKMSRFRASAWATKSTGPMKGNTAGTLYVPSLVGEQNWLNIFSEKIAMIGRAYFRPSGSIITTGSATSPAIPSSSMDYIFLDPPFGANLLYSELNFLWESWLRLWTNSKTEAIECKAQSKDLEAYRGLMAESFRAAFAILKPGRWMTVEFSNTKASVWNAIQSALQECGFVVANVATLDKQQGSFKAVTTATAVKQDLVISAYKPNGGLEERFAKTGPTAAGVWDFIRTHLNNLPIVKAKGGEMESIAERDPRILYDRTVAFYVGHSIPVPLSSAEFQAELGSQFVERDGMWFLPEQVNEYDKKRAQMENVGQIVIFVEDERSAIDWVRTQLKEKPQTYQEIQPGFMQQLNASWKKWEARPELKVLLDQNFLCYDGAGEVPSQIHSYLSSQFKELRNLAKDHAQLRQKGKDRWYVPDPKKNVDVETVRNKRLLEEFWSYLPDGYLSAARSPDRNPTLSIPGLASPRPKVPRSKKLKQVRTEAVRVGFKYCYQQKDYPTILAVADMLPESVLNEDEQLQMLYDNAALRAETTA